MKTIAASATALMMLTAAAMADEPIVLSEAKMDGVTAGADTSISEPLERGFGLSLGTNTGSTSVQGEGVFDGVLDGSVWPESSSTASSPDRYTFGVEKSFF